VQKLQKPKSGIGQRNEKKTQKKIHFSRYFFGKNRVAA
jgi:hypothetical protein